MLTVVALALFAGLFAIPGLHFDRLVTRIMLPLSNVDRVSRTVVRIIEPDPAEQMVPRGDPLTVLVALSGPEADRVILETFRDGAADDPIVMQAVGETRRYAGTMHTDADVLQAMQDVLSQAAPDDLILITGSLYILGEAREYWVSSQQLLIEAEQGLRYL